MEQGAEMTIDMTKNRVPYGLLTDEEKAALHEHEKAGGEFNKHWGGGWAQVKPSWYHNVVYRTVPLPKTQDVIAWERLPAWVEWVARDESGKVHCSDVEATTCGGHWMYRLPTDVRRIDDFPGIVQIGTVDWKDSKQRRPRG
jgi:hypothetical protein